MLNIRDVLNFVKAMRTFKTVVMLLSAVFEMCVKDCNGNPFLPVFSAKKIGVESLTRLVFGGERPEILQYILKAVP